MDAQSLRRRRLSHSLRLLMLALLMAFSVISVPGGRPALAAPPGFVRYDSFNNIIYVGHNYSAADPAEAPYIGWPSKADAPKTEITIPEVDTELTAQGFPDLLDNQGGGAWLLKSDMVISQTAKLNATGASITELRLDSEPRDDRPFPFLVKLIARGGYLRIEDIKVRSWAGSGVDTDYYDGRSFLLAELGGRMDIIHSEVSYLGWGDGEPSGLSWRKRATQNTPETGATGNILDSDIHNNYFGQYSYEAYGLKALRNQFHHNVYYGFDPHDYSQGFEVAYNTVYNNGKHGIIFSRGCINNRIHHNVVYGNAEHGIMLDRGSDNNLIEYNESYNNGDGVAIFQSANNVVRYNTLHNNERGVRVNATFAPGDEYDGTSTVNKITNNIITDNSEYGIYLYERADKNTIEANTITGSAKSGIYIKTGANVIKGNTLRTNGVGITILGSEAYTPGLVAPSGKPGQDNTIQGNLIEDNEGSGIQMKSGVDTLIGIKASLPNAADANVINTNGSHGISFDSASSKNIVEGNKIHGNQLDGVNSKGAGSIKNRITRNSITANGRSGIRVDDGAANNIQPPAVTSTAAATTVTGTAAPGVTIEVYRDPGGQGNVYVGTTTANGQGNWSFPLPGSDNPQAGSITAIAIDSNGNTSAFGGVTSGSTTAVYTVGSGRNGELTVYVTGPGAIVSLPDIERALQVISPTTTLLENQGNNVWQANASLFFNRGVTLTLTTETASWLKLRSQGEDIQLAAAGDAEYNYRSFVTLRTYSGAILIDGVKITSWDPQHDTFDTDVSDGRSYLLAKYAARMDIKNAELAYLGSADGESYGVSWRDINSSEEPDVLLTRVTGQVLNSDFHHNYYGIYTFQASNMVFRNNKFHHNIGYGFDPHDFTHHVVVEDNEAFENGNHGFIISRGCNSFVFRRNKSYNNHYSVTDDDRNAHGFMIDPGSPNSQFAQVPSHANLFEHNQAWGNDGYGMRILGSISNTVQLNTFTGNLQGITLEEGSTGNIIATNTISGSLLYGIYLIGGSDGTKITGNTISGSGKHGIYIKTSQNTISKNIVTNNGSIIDGVPAGSGIASLQESDLAAAAADLTLPGQTVSLAARDPDLLAVPDLTGGVDGNVITQNTVSGNQDEGIELKSATNTRVEGNTIEANGSNGIYLSSGAGANMLKKNTIKANRGYGIRANGSDVFGNTWTENLVFENRGGGIVNTSSANNAIKAPKLVKEGNEVTGTTLPGATVELFSDAGGQGRYYETRVIAEDDGTFRAARAWKGTAVNATVTDQDGNTSGFTYNVAFSPSSTVFLPFIRR